MASSRSQADVPVAGEDKMALQPHANEMTAEIRSLAADLAELDQKVATKITTATADVRDFSFPPEALIQSSGIQALDVKQSPPPPDPGTPGDPPWRPVLTGHPVRCAGSSPRCGAADRPADTGLAAVVDRPGAAGFPDRPAGVGSGSVSDHQALA